MRRTTCVTGVTLAALWMQLQIVAADPVPATSAAKPEDAPANQWVRLADAPPALDYKYNNAVYDPIRKRMVLYTPRGVASFDAAAGNWALEYDAYAGKSGPTPPGPTDGARGVSIKGSGALTSSGHPEPSYTTYGACWDSKRNRVTLVMRGLMAAYDPEAKKWTDLKAKTILNGKEYSGGPPLYNMGVCYDPVNDEILMQPHFATYTDWIYPGGDFPPMLNMDRVPVDGRISSHFGTFRYSFADNTWRRVGETFGTDEQKASRKAVLDLTAAVSVVSDQAWALRRKADAFDQVKVKASLADALSTAETLAGKLPAEARESFAKVIPHLKAAADAAKADKWDEALVASGKAWWELDSVLDDALRVEPEPRCNGPMFHDAKNQVIVVSGGSNGLVRTDVGGSERAKAGNPALRTWLYECRTRQWRRAKGTLPGRVVGYDSASGLMLSITQKEQDYGRTIPPTITLWTLNVATGECFQRHEQSSPAAEWPGLYDPSANVSYDPERDLLLFTHHNASPKGPAKYETFAMKLDLAALPAGKPASQNAIPIRPHFLPPDDPQWVEHLKTMPTNQWAVPWKYGPALRGWGSATCDPLSGNMYYFGGGHATYQVNDVAVYAVGANRWTSGVGEFNDFFVPGVRWNGFTKGFRGGHEAAHMSFYDALDGRMYIRCGTVKPLYQDEAKSPDWRYSSFYDVNRGGIWRYKKVPDVTFGQEVDRAIGFVNLADPSGRMLGMVGGFVWNGGKQGTFSILDVYADKLKVQLMPVGGPGGIGEGTQHCYVAPLKKMFAVGPKGTFLYDPDTNAWTDLKARGQPLVNTNNRTNVVLSLDGHDAVYVWANGQSGKGKEWVYSFKHNAWAPLKTNRTSLKDWGGPYGQIGYAAKYGVLVSTIEGVMRPDLSAVDWTAAAHTSTTQKDSP